jgi:hypothetical protein
LHNQATAFLEVQASQVQSPATSSSSAPVVVAPHGALMATAQETVAVVLVELVATTTSLVTQASQTPVPAVAAVALGVLMVAPVPTELL